MLVSRKYDNYDYKQHNIADKADGRKLQPNVKTNAKARAKCLMFVILCAMMAMFVTVRSELIVSNGYDLVRMKEEIMKVEKENELLYLEISRLKSPQRIQYIATTELGMIVPKQIVCSTYPETNNKVLAEQQIAATDLVSIIGKMIK